LASKVISGNSLHPITLAAHAAVSFDSASHTKSVKKT
jgi:hypothetical protein